jgi:nucleotide-binding universal stress UspA family protein
VFRRIVVGFDESDGSRDALALGRTLADRLDSELVLAAVVPAPTGGSLVPALPANAFTNLVEQARAGLERAAAEAGASSEIIESSSASRGLEELTERLEGDLLILGCARTGPGTVRAGHKARVLLQGSRGAVALAPVGFREHSGELSVIGAAVDGSPESGHALEAAAALAHAGTGNTLRVISVATDFAEAWGLWGATYALAELGDASRKIANEVLDKAMQSVPEGVEADRVMREGPAADELRRESGAGLDMLCVGSRGYGPIRRVLLGSVTSELLREAACPVLVLPRT